MTLLYNKVMEISDEKYFYIKDYKYIDNIYDGSTDSTKLTISSEMNNAQAEKMILLEVYRVKSYK